MNTDNEEQIKNRMLKKAAALWGVPAKEIEASFDPVVSLLIGACASEIEKISNKINESQTNITEKIIQLMTPDTIAGAKPAHGIIHITPLEKEVTVTPDFVFSFKKKITEQARVNFKNLYFSPSQNFKTVNANVTYLAADNSVLEIDGKKNNSVLFSGTDSFFNQSELYLGITTSFNQLSFKNTSFYFELENFESTTLFYHHLRDAKWYIGDKEIKVKAGFYNSKNEEEFILDTILNENSIKLGTINEEVKNNYTRHYITIEEDFLLNKEIPKELTDVINSNKLPINEDVVWIKVQFPRVISNQLLKEVHCSLNTLPILNRKLEEFSYKLKEYINIVPVNVTDLFLDIKSISNIEGQQYQLLNKNISSEEKGSYSLKTDSISKLDNRKAKDYIYQLISLLRDESASFSFLKNDFLHTNLKTLNQLISQLENKVAEIPRDEYHTKYVAVNPFIEKDTLLIEYWTTNGSIGNNIKYGSAFSVYKGLDIEQNSPFLVSSTFGGRDELSMNERLESYRRTLLSRDRVVTKEDVKASCFEFLGTKITDVEVKNGYTIDISLNKGFINCIDIILTPNQDEDFDIREWDFLKNNLLSYLKKKSINVFPYVIKLKE